MQNVLMWVSLEDFFLVKQSAFVSEQWVFALYFGIVKLVRVLSFKYDLVIPFTPQDPAIVTVRLSCLHKLV